MRDPKRFGRDLAERMAAQMRTRSLSGKQALRQVASEVAGTANTMVAGGKPREDVTKWVGEVQRACVARVEEQLIAIEARGLPFSPAKDMPSPNLDLSP
jgi:hypothetical protein